MSSKGQKQQEESVQLVNQEKQVKEEEQVKPIQVNKVILVKDKLLQYKQNVGKVIEELLTKLTLITKCLIDFIQRNKGVFKYLKIIGGSIIFALVLLYFFQNQILYMPVIPGATRFSSQNRKGWRHPSEQGCYTQDVQVTTSDALKLKGWLIKSQTSERLIVYFHQNAGNLGLRIHFLKNIHQRTNSDVLIVAYRGYSDSQGSPTQKGLQRDSIAILDWAIDYKNHKISKGQQFKIFLLGRSLGGAVTLQISTKKEYSHEISGLILENTFTSIQDVIKTMPILAPFSFINKNYWPSITRIPQVKQPILFIRSLKDELVPTEQMAQLIKSAVKAQFKREYEITDGTHNLSWQLDAEAYFDEYNSFFEAVQSK